MTNGTTATTKEPNLYELSGDGIQVTYITAGFDGKPHFNYHDPNVSKTFTGDQIQVADDAALGKLVSVVILPSVDTGSTTFTIIIPRVNLRSADSANITTYAVTALHKVSLVLPPSGQQDFYTAHQMQGTASFTFF